MSFRNDRAIIHFAIDDGAPLPFTAGPQGNTASVSGTVTFPSNMVTPRMSSFDINDGGNDYIFSTLQPQSGTGPTWNFTATLTQTMCPTKNAQYMLTVNFWDSSGVWSPGSVWFTRTA